MEKITADDRKLLEEIFETNDPDQLVKRIFTYYHDDERAERTPRAQMYLHLGMLSGVVLRVLDSRRASLKGAQ